MAGLGSGGRRLAGRRHELWKHPEALAFRRHGKPLVQTDEGERARKLFLDEERGAKLTRIGRPQRVPGKERARASANGEHIGHFIPTGREGIEPLERFAAL